MFAQHKRMIGRLYLAGDALVAVASFAEAQASHEAIYRDRMRGGRAGAA